MCVFWSVSHSVNPIHPDDFADVWGTAVASGDALKLSQMVLDWSASKPEVALSLLRSCVTLLEKDLHDCVAEPAPSLSVPHGECLLRFSDGDH